MHEEGLFGGIAKKPSVHTKSHSLLPVTAGFACGGYVHCTPTLLICEKRV